MRADPPRRGKITAMAGGQGFRTNVDVISFKSCTKFPKPNILLDSIFKYVQWLLLANYMKQALRKEINIPKTTSVNQLALSTGDYGCYCHVYVQSWKSTLFHFEVG